MGKANGIHGRESHIYKILIGEPAGKKHMEELNLEKNIVQYYINITLKIYHISTNTMRRRGVD